ncbi:uncharacterized protein I206_101944 [Kwoniella pini CBS 10737]|uniref:Uncharacterized protein n=1 Tax=Kwoniella pini CBS 10737 TaxID=1296096 RepID=A0A1B9HV89_9TREE|nr:uncharacterized protein I206_06965 [Kwoniella pini CBS 10737]OCF47187.1 hypothetical protein I206_06965 [Kwoniella pini CBS 10737]
MSNDNTHHGEQDVLSEYFEKRRERIDVPDLTSKLKSSRDARERAVGRWLDFYSGNIETARAKLEDVQAIRRRHNSDINRTQSYTAGEWRLVYNHQKIALQESQDEKPWPDPDHYFVDAYPAGTRFTLPPSFKDYPPIPGGSTTISQHRETQRAQSHTLAEVGIDVMRKAINDIWNNISSGTSQ